MRKTTLWIALLLIALLGAMAATPRLKPVPPVRTDSAPFEFDVFRAHSRLANILGDGEAHPADSPASDGVRERLVEELRAIGISPVVRDQVACNEIHKARGVACARVRNVIATIGRARGPRLLLNAHYDSSTAGPGAGDDGAGVATLLEVAAILRNEPLRRPITFLFNEGEELGLVGARAFLADPLSREVDSLINLEARGVSGPANMFETSTPNGVAVEAFALAVDRPVANSLATDVYRQMPNYTDVNTFSERGWLTLNFAMIGNETRYHSPGDTIGALDLRSLQHMGDQALAMARGIDRGAPRAHGDHIFMDLLGQWLIHMPQAIGLVLLGASLVGLAWLAWRRRALGRGLAVIGGGLLLATALAWLGTATVGVVRPGMFWRAYPLWTHAAVYASALVAAIVLLATVGRRLDTGQLRAAFWLAFMMLGVVIAVAAPLGIIFFLLPPLAFGLGVIAQRWHRHAERIGAWLAILMLYLTLGAMVGQLEELLSRGPLWLFAPLGLLVMVPVLIEAKALFDASPSRVAIGVGGALALAGWAASAIAPAYSSDRAQQQTLEHVVDAANGRAYWSLLNDGAPPPDAWGGLANWKIGELPYSKRKRWLAPAPDEGVLLPPAASILATARAAGGRRVTVRLIPNGADSIALIAPEDSRVLRAGTSGFVRPIDQQLEKAMTVIRCTGRSCDGIILDIALADAAPVEFILTASSSRLPRAAIPFLERYPPLARPQYTPHQSVVFTHVRL